MSCHRVFRVLRMLMVANRYMRVMPIPMMCMHHIYVSADIAVRVAVCVSARLFVLCRALCCGVMFRGRASFCAV